MILLFITSIGFRYSGAQDINISQTFAAPLLLNPSLTGAYDGNFRLSLLHRNQWGSMLGDPYQSFMISGDARLNFGRKISRNGYFAAGVLFYSDRINPFDYSTNSMTFNGAYHLKTGPRKNNLLSAGVQAGLAQKNFSYEDFTFQDQFNGVDGFPFSTLENLPVNNFSFFDLSLGVNYITSLENDNVLSVGLAVFHAHEPNVSFFKDIEDMGVPVLTENSLKRRYTAYTSVNYRANEFFEWSPRIAVMSQGKHFQALAGTGARYLISDVKGTSLHFGAWGRITNDVDSYSIRDIILMVGIEHESLIFGFSYDLSVDDIRTYQAGQHTFEFSLRYTGDYQDDELYCPQF